MAKTNRHRPARVNFFDGQRVTEADLDSEQVHHRSLVSDLTRDFHASGIVRDRLFGSRVLLNTANPGVYSEDGNEVTKFLIDSGAYDGRAIKLDQQPSDIEYGNRLEVECSGLDVGGRISCKVLILGTTYSSLNDGGDLVFEILDFSQNQTKLTEHYYTKVISVLFNNLSGGLGRTHLEYSVESFNTAGEKGYVEIRESEPLKVFSRTKSVHQDESPNISARDFISSNPANTLRDELSIALGAAYNFNQLYFELDSKEKVRFLRDGNSTVAFGQKFLAKSNNLQKIDLLLSLEKDSDDSLLDELTFSGELVLSVHKLSTDIKCITDPNPDNLIDFDPEQTPLMELSYNMEDFKAQGITLGETPQIVSFDFSGTLLADPNIEPSFVPGDFYAFMVSRRGDNRQGTVVLEKGFSKIFKKISNGQPLTALERFGRKTSRYIEYDPNSSTFIDDEDSSLWFSIHSNSLEVTDGLAYADDGYPIVLPKTEDYIGSTYISSYLRDVDLRDVSSDGKNYVILSRKDSFESPGVHPRTGNFVNTRIKDVPSVSVVTADELDELLKTGFPIILASASDKNIKDAQDIEGSFDVPGMIRQDEIILVNPSQEILESNLIGRIFTPDIDCDCTSRYKIISTTCEVKRVADFDDDGSLSVSDITKLLSVVGNTINSETTERRILGGELDVVDFIKSDLNGDGTVDGDDITLAENAAKGKIDFGVPESFKLFRIKLENLSDKDDSPVIFSSEVDSSVAESGSTFSGQNIVSFQVSKEEQALVIRVGDILTIEGEASDSGAYLVSSKVVDGSGVGVSLGVTDIYGEDLAFSGASGLNVVVTSGTTTNMLADNLDLSAVPYSGTSWRMSDELSTPSQDFLAVCDLRRYVETNFIERLEGKCECEDETCGYGEKCSPIYKNQKVLADDLFLPRGEIYKEPGVPYHGDIEYATISIPLPPGTIDDCAIDLYTNFIKAHDGTCKTASGYPAMLYSDGTYVGCEDSGTSTDITKGRVKIKQAIASLHVDSFVDGYAVDGYADETDTYYTAELVEESFTDFSYPNSLGFTEWPAETPWSYAKANYVAGENEPVEFELTTVNAGERSARINYPSGIIPDLSGDFVIDFAATRVEWDEQSLLFGSVVFGSKLKIVNSNGTEAVIEFGWKQFAHKDAVIYYKSTVYDSATLTPITDDVVEVPADDDIGDEVIFRLRRVDEAIFPMYYDKTLISTGALVDGDFTRIGGLATVQPGLGDGQLSFELTQYDNPNPGEKFICRLSDVVLNYNYDSRSNNSENLTISRDSLGETNRAIATFPILLTRRTNIISAKLSLTVQQAISSTEAFHVIPFDIINADNLGLLIDYPLERNHSFITSFIPGDLVAGESIEVDITSIIIYFLSQPGHLPGFLKAIAIEPSMKTEESILVSPDIKMDIEYEDITTGVVFKVGTSIDPATGIVTLSTKNVLYDAVNETNRTVLKFGVHLKKSGFKNKDVEIGLSDLTRIGIGTCSDETPLEDEELCFFVAGSTATGTFVEGPFPCYFHLPK